MEIEICCGSFLDALNAYKGKASRIELNSALYLGGLTPTIACLRLIKENTNLKVISMVRPRAGGFNYTNDEYKQMYIETKLLLENGADGIAFGILNDNYDIDERNIELLKLIKQFNKEAIFHRAFDQTSNPYNAIEKLIALGFDRVLTSGQKKTAIEGKELIKDLQFKYGDKIEILAGSGINDTNAKDFVEYTGVKQIHSSCKDYLIDVTANKNVSFDYLNDNKYEIVSTDKVKKLISLF